jgi:hypothetical protein
LKTQNKILIGISLTSSLAMTACGIKLPDEPQQTTAHWADPANYSRTPTGENPVDPITLSVDFSDQTGCPNETYRFWLFSADGGTPLGGIGQNAPSVLNHFEQAIHLPIDVPIYAIRLVCTKANGDRYSNGTILEQGDPAFIPRTAISWQNPENYVRTPSGATPTDPITFSTDFTDESGCPTQMYRFWQYAQNGTPVGGVGEIVTMANFGITTTASLPAGTPVYAIRLACVDGDGNIADTTSNLEFGLPAFTPTTSGNCSGQNATLCESPESSENCAICEGTWGDCSAEQDTPIALPASFYGRAFVQNAHYSLSYTYGGTCGSGNHIAITIMGDAPRTWWTTTASVPCVEESNHVYAFDFEPQSTTSQGSNIYASTYSNPITTEYYGVGDNDPNWSTYLNGYQWEIDNPTTTSTPPYWTVTATDSCAEFQTETACTASTSPDCSWDSICNAPDTSLCVTPTDEATCTACGGTWQ